MLTDIKGKHAILTGAAEGLGNQIARAYSRAGLRLTLMDNQAAKRALTVEPLCPGAAYPRASAPAHPWQAALRRFAVVYQAL